MIDSYLTSMPSAGSPEPITILLSPEELRAVVSMLDDQLFRVKFIDPKMPGYQTDKARVKAAETALEALKSAGKHYLRPSSHGASDIILPQKAPRLSNFNRSSRRDGSDSRA